MSTYADLPNKELRKLASAKAKAAGWENKNIGQRGKSSECRDYLELDAWAAKWGEPTPIRAKAAPEPADDQTLDLFGTPALVDASNEVHQDQQDLLSDEAPVVVDLDHISEAMPADPPDAVEVATKIEMSLLPDKRPVQK